MMVIRATRAPQGRFPVPPVFSEGHEARTSRVTESGYLRRPPAGTSRRLQRLTIGCRDGRQVTSRLVKAVHPA
jgi:hypothetical protein